MDAILASWLQTLKRSLGATIARLDAILWPKSLGHLVVSTCDPEANTRFYKVDNTGKHILHLVLMTRHSFKLWLFD
jgi:hypothetical protein